MSGGVQQPETLDTHGMAFSVSVCVFVRTQRSTLLL